MLSSWYLDLRRKPTIRCYSAARCRKTNTNKSRFLLIFLFFFCSETNVRLKPQHHLLCNTLHHDVHRASSISNRVHRKWGCHYEHLSISNTTGSQIGILRCRKSKQTFLFSVQTEFKSFFFFFQKWVYSMETSYY